jgi:hypothetical protein
MLICHIPWSIKALINVLTNIVLEEGGGGGGGGGVDTTPSLSYRGRLYET